MTLSAETQAWINQRRKAVRRHELQVRVGPNAVPDRIAIDAHGYGWRVWDDEDHWSMVPQNPDNSPIPQPVTWFVPAADDRQTQIRAVAAECSVVLYSGSSDCCVWCGNHGEADTDDFCSLASLLATLLAPAVSLELPEPPIACECGHQERHHGTINDGNCHFCGCDNFRSSTEPPIEDAGSGGVK